MCVWPQQPFVCVWVCVWQPCTALCDFSISPGGGSVKRPPPGPSKAWNVICHGARAQRSASACVTVCVCVWVKCSFCIQSAAQQQLAQVRGAAETEAENEENSSYSFSRTSGCESVTSFVVACFVIFDIFSGFTSVSIWKSNYLKKKSEIKKKERKEEITLAEK